MIQNSWRVHWSWWRRDAFLVPWSATLPSNLLQKEEYQTATTAYDRKPFDFGIMFHLTYPRKSKRCPNCSLYIHKWWTGLLHINQNQTVKLKWNHRISIQKHPAYKFVLLTMSWLNMKYINERKPMDFSSLLKAYERAELEGLAGPTWWQGWTCSITALHESKKAPKHCKCYLSKQGEILTAEWLDDGSRIIFPVTPASVTRTAKPEPHPLVDKLKTYTPDFPAYQVFHERLKAWMLSARVAFMNSDIITKAILDEDSLWRTCQ